MIKKVLFIAFAVILFSCKQEAHQISEQVPLTPQQMILGHWTPEDRPLKKGEHRQIHGDYRGFEFMPDSVCDYKSGFLDWERYMNDTTTPREETVSYYLGTLTKYSLSGKQLNIYNLSDKIWETYKVEKLTADTLVINQDTVPKTFIKRNYDTTRFPDFDAVVVSSSPCFGSCPMGSTMITKEGIVYFRGDYHTIVKGNYIAKITSEEFKKLALKFEQANYYALESNYFTLVSDSQTVTVSFIKNGKIIKSITDYARSSPNEFIWAYNPIIYLNQKLDLKPVKMKEYLTAEFLIGNIKNETEHLSLEKSELFYLLYKLGTGKEIKTTFNEKYNLSLSNNPTEKITTDGRYYKFYFKDKTTKTIDIGYNFLTNNLVQKFQKKHE